MVLTGSPECQHVSTQHGPPTPCNPTQDSDRQPAGDAVTTLPTTPGSAPSWLRTWLFCIAKNLKGLSLGSSLLSLCSSKRDFRPTLQVLGVQCN